MIYSQPKLWYTRARQQGRDARLGGRPLVSCPYPTASTLWRLWRTGWHDEQVFDILGDVS